MGLFLPLLLVLAAAMFAGSFGDDSVTGFVVSGDGETCKECKDNCQGAYDSAVKTCGDVHAGCFEGVANSYNACISVPLPSGQCMAIMKEAINQCNDSKDLCVASAESAKKGCEDACEDDAAEEDETCDEPEEEEEEEEKPEKEKKPKEWWE